MRIATFRGAPAVLILGLISQQPVAADTGSITPASGPLGTTVTIQIDSCAGSIFDGVVLGNSDGIYKNITYLGQGRTLPATVQVVVGGPPDSQGIAERLLPEPGDKLFVYAACHNAGPVTPGVPPVQDAVQLNKVDGLSFTVTGPAHPDSAIVVGEPRKLPARQKIGKVRYRSTTPKVCLVAQGRKLIPLKPGTCRVKAVNAKGKSVKLVIRSVAP